MSIRALLMIADTALLVLLGELLSERVKAPQVPLLVPIFDEMIAEENVRVLSGSALEPQGNPTEVTLFKLNIPSGSRAGELFLGLIPWSMEWGQPNGLLHLADDSGREFTGELQPVWSCEEGCPRGAKLWVRVPSNETSFFTICHERLSKRRSEKASRRMGTKGIVELRAKGSRGWCITGGSKERCRVLLPSAASRDRIVSSRVSESNSVCGSRVFRGEFSGRLSGASRTAQGIGSSRVSKPSGFGDIGAYGWLGCHLEPNQSRATCSVQYVANEEGVTHGLILKVEPWGTKSKKRSIRANGVLLVETSEKGVELGISCNTSSAVLSRIGDLEEELADSIDSVVIEIGEGSDRFSMRVDEFTARLPSALVVLDNGTIEWDGYPAPFMWREGRSIRRDFSVAWDGKDPPKVSWIPRQLTLEVLTPENGESGDRAGGIFEPEKSSSFGSDSRWIGSIESRRHSIDRVIGSLEAVRGVLDFGDYLLGRSQWGNLEFDPLAALCISGSSGLEGWIDSMARHWITRDINRSQGPGKGLPWKHGFEHDSGGFELGHVFIEGALLAETMTLDPSLSCAVSEMASSLLKACEDPELFINDRCYGWTLINVCALAHTGRHPRAVGAIRMLLKRLKTRIQEDGGLALDYSSEDQWPEVNVWVHSLTTLEGLRRAAPHCAEALELRFGILEWLMSHISLDPLSVPHIVVYKREKPGEPWVCYREGDLGTCARLIVAAALTEGARDYGRSDWHFAARAILDSLPQSGLDPRSTVDAINVLHSLNRLESRTFIPFEFMSNHSTPFSGYNH